MRDFIGTVLARILIKAGRAALEMPLEASISILHDLVMRVQFADITKKSDDRFVFSERVRTEREAAKKKLSELWAEEQAESENQPDTVNGPPDPASG
jgi:hypothetical protein